MRTCIISLGVVNSYSVICDDNLVIHKIITDFSEIINLLYKQRIDKLKIFCQGTPVKVKTTDSVKISNLNLSGNDVPVVVRDRDLMFLTEVATLLMIEDVNVYSYTDYIMYKFKDDGELIVVTPYLTDYAVFYLKDNQIKDFSKVSLVNLPRKIGKFKDLYNCPVVNIYNKIDLIGIGSILRNYKSIPDDQIWSLDYLPFLMNTEGQPLVEDSHDLDFIDEEQDENREPEVKSEEVEPEEVEPEEDDEDELGEGFLDDEELEKMLNNTKKDLKESNKSNAKFNFNDLGGPPEDEEGSKVSDVIVTCLIAVFLLLGIVGISISVIYSGKITKLTESLTLEESKESSSADLKEYLNGDMTKSPFTKTYLCYTQLNSLKISNCGYENGNLTITLLAKDDAEVSSNEQKVQEFYLIKDKGYLGKYQDAGVDYEKTKYILTLREQ